MHWLNFHTSTLDSEEFLCSAPTDQATWLKLLRYAVGQENGGTILGAKAWSELEWRQLVRVAPGEVSHSCRLWQWDGDNLTIRFYPIDGQSKAEAQRKAAYSTHKKRAAERRAEHVGKQGANIKQHKVKQSKATQGNGVAAVAAAGEHPAGELESGKKNPARNGEDEFGHIPTPKEMYEHFQATGQAVTKPVCDAYAKWQDTHEGWIRKSPAGKRFRAKWEIEVPDWQLRERVAKSATGSSGAPDKTREQIEEELEEVRAEKQWQREEKRLEELKQREKELEKLL